MKDLPNKENYFEYFNSCTPELARIAYTKLHDEMLVEDAIQCACIKGYMNIESLENPKLFKSWIIKILVNECYDLIRKDASESAKIAKVSEKLNNEVVNEYDNIDKKIYIEQLLSTLSEDERKLIYLRFKNDYTVAQIAKILNENPNTVKSKIRRIMENINRIAIIIVAIIVLTATVVGAIELVKHFYNLFTTSTNAINTLVENNLVQNPDMSFVYSNNIGIKVDSFIFDGKSLDISYVYDCVDADEIEEICLKDHQIVDEKENIIKSFDDIELSYAVRSYSNKVVQDNNYFIHSILYTTDNEYPDFKKLNIEVKTVYVKYKTGIEEEIVGKWKFNVDKTSEIMSEVDKYEIFYDSPYIDSVNVKAYPTYLEIYIVLEINMKLEKLIALEDFELKDDNAKEYSLLDLKIKEIVNKNLYCLKYKYDISNLNNENLNCAGYLDKDKYIEINLKSRF